MVKWRSDIYVLFCVQQWLLQVVLCRASTSCCGVADVLRFSMVGLSGLGRNLRAKREIIISGIRDSDIISL